MTSAAFSTGLALLLLLAAPGTPASAAVDSVAPPVFRLSPGTKDGPWIARFRAAVDAIRSAGGGILELDSGRFPLAWGDTLLLDGVRNLILQGQAGKTRIIAHPDSAPARYFLKLRACGNVLIRDIAFEGKVLPQARRADNAEWHTGIAIVEGEDIHIRACRFSGFFTGGIHFNKTRRSSVMDSRFRGVDNKQSGDYGSLHLQEVDGHLAERNEFLSVRYSGISGWQARRVQAIGNTIEVVAASPYGMGMYFIGGLDQSILSRNRIAKPGSEGITVHGRRGQPVVGNLIADNTISAGWAGIAINDTGQDVGETRANVLSGNSISGTAADPLDHGILIHSGHLSRIEGNKVTRSRLGINLRYRGTGNEIIGNIVRRTRIAISAEGEARVEGNQIDSASDAGVLVSYTRRTQVRRNAFRSTRDKVLSGDGVAPGALEVDPPTPP